MGAAARATQVRQQALGYLRLHAGDPSEIAAALTAELQAYADKAGLDVATVYTDVFDPPDGLPDRAGFCALMDALRRGDAQAVIIPSAQHLARRARSYAARRTIIDIEGGARLLVVHAGPGGP